MKYLWTAVNVKELDQSIRFYTGLAGLQVLRRFPAGPGLEIAFLGNGAEGETLLELLADKTKEAPGHGDSVSAGFLVPSLEQQLEAVREFGLAPAAGPFETPAMRYFSVKDPDGFMVQFFQYKS